jgi:hypothetical protein
MIRWIRSVLVFAAIACAPSCVETGAVDYHPPNPNPASPDGGSVAGDGGATLVAACRECMTNGGCAAETQACNTDDRCARYLECSIVEYCLNYSFTDLAHSPPCVNECANAGSINGQTDPIIALVAPVALCAQNPATCGPACNVR